MESNLVFGMFGNMSCSETGMRAMDGRMKSCRPLKSHPEDILFRFSMNAMKILNR
jgi:hypothetical protein